MPRFVDYIVLVVFCLLFMLLAVFTAAIARGAVPFGAEMICAAGVTLLSGALAVLMAMELWSRLRRETRLVETRLLDYPGPVLLKTPAIESLLVAAAFVGMGVFLLFLGHSLPIVIHVLQGLVGVCFLVVALLAAMATVSAKIRSLRLSRDDFEIVSLWKSKIIRWNDTSEFTVTILAPEGWTVETRKAVVCNVNSSRTSIITTKANTEHYWHFIYGLKTHEELAALLNAWRAQALQDTVAAKP